MTDTTKAPAFDLARLDILTPSEEGRALILLHPATGRPFKRSDGEDVAITLRGRNSAIAKATLRQIQDERAAIEAEARAVTPDDNDKWNTRYLVALTAGWGFEELDGQEFSCNPVNAEKFWTDPRFVWLRPRALEFVAFDGNFLGA